MIIGGYKVGQGIYKIINNQEHLIFNCKNCVFSTSLADDKACRLHAITFLAKQKADMVVLADVYERVYNSNQTTLLRQIGELYSAFSAHGLWGPEHLSDGSDENEQYTANRHATLAKIASDYLVSDPILAYLATIDEINKEKLRLTKLGSKYQKGAMPYLETLIYIYQSLEKTDLIKKVKDYLQKLTNIPDTSQLYRYFFNAEIKPSFIGSRLLFGEVEGLVLVDEYMVGNTQIQIFKQPDSVEYLYIANPPEYSLTPDKYFIISKAREIVAEYKPGSAAFTVGAKSRDYFERVFLTTIKGVSKANSIPLSLDEEKSLSEIVARYTVGYGILEILLSDKNITDFYVDAPIGDKPLKLIHSKFGPCKTNILYSEREAESVVSKIRAQSGRPFDETHPVLDYDLPEFETRVAVIGPPLSPDGIAFAFRLHKTTPWTLPQLVNVNGMNSLSAGLLSFLVDMQSSILVAGSRGSGKTSLLSALMLEIPMSSRILLQEDTLEIPAMYMKNIGYNVQRLKTQSAITTSKVGVEVPPDEALRTALRLGDSAIILGEVRSKEAKVLYEAMRVGAAGNVVMGTIHGDSAYSVWDRVVNDLEVPTTSFKATDIVTVSRPIRFKGSLKRNRRLVQITEVKKHWNEDPETEGGLLDLMSYNAKKDNLDLLEDNLKDSELFTKIQSVSGLNMEQIWKEISMVSKTKQYLVDLKTKLNFSDLLEAENTTIANTSLHLFREKQMEESDTLNLDELYTTWKNWVDKDFVPFLNKKYDRK